MTCTLSWGVMILMICLQMMHTNHQGQEAKTRWNARGREFEYECVPVMPRLNFSWQMMSPWLKHIQYRQFAARTGQSLSWLYDTVLKTWWPFIHVCILWYSVTIVKCHIKGCKSLRIGHYFPHNNLFCFYSLNFLFCSCFFIVILPWMPPHKWRVKQA